MLLPLCPCHQTKKKAAAAERILGNLNLLKLRDKYEGIPCLISASEKGDNGSFLI